ncbi:MAG: tetratricopeptide repeat protein, partial [Chloroflexota bacterium]
ERSSNGSSWRFHSLIRQVQITYLQQSEPDETKKFHQRAFEYYIGNKNLEAIYHHIFLNKKEGVDVWYHFTQDFMRFTKSGSDFLFELIQEPELEFDGREKSWIELLKGRYALHHSHYDEAIEVLTNLLSWTDISSVKAHAHKHIARAYTYKQNSDLAKQHLETAQALYESNEELLGFADTFHQMGNIEYYQDNYNESETYYLQAIRILKDNDLYTNSGNSYLKIGQIAEKKQLTQKARKHYKKAYQIFKQDADFLGVGNSLMLSAGVAPKHQLKNTIQKYYQAIEIFEEIGVQRDLANVHLKLGKFMIEVVAVQSHKKGNFPHTLSTLESAEPHIRKALTIYESLNDKLLQAWCHLSLSEILTKSINSYEDGFNHLLEAKNLFTLSENNEEIELCQLMIEEIRSEKGDNISLYVLIGRWIEGSRNMQQSLEYARSNSFLLLTEETEQLLQRMHERKADWGTKLYLPIVKTARKEGWIIAYDKHWNYGK